jgi:hypothetical protein
MATKTKKPAKYYITVEAEIPHEYPRGNKDVMPSFMGEQIANQLKRAGWVNVTTSEPERR